MRVMRKGKDGAMIGEGTERGKRKLTGTTRSGPFLALCFLLYIQETDLPSWSIAPLLFGRLRVDAMRRIRNAARQLSHRQAHCGRAAQDGQVRHHVVADG